MCNTTSICIFLHEFDIVFSLSKINSPREIDPSKNQPKGAFHRLFPAQARVRVELVDNAERALVLASPALDVDAGAPFADLEGLKRKVSSLRHYVDSHEVWAFGAREPGADDPFDDAVALLGAFGAFCDRSSKNRTLIWSLGLADVLSELVDGFDVDMGTVGEALRLRELVRCFTTGLHRSQFETLKEVDFDLDHKPRCAMLNYVHFIGYVMHKDCVNDSPLERAVRDKLRDGDASWIPTLTCFSLENHGQAEREQVGEDEQVRALIADVAARSDARLDALAAAVADLARGAARDRAPTADDARPP